MISAGGRASALGVLVPEAAMIGLPMSTLLGLSAPDFRFPAADVLLSGSSRPTRLFPTLAPERQVASEAEYASGENRGSGRLALIVCGAPVPGKQFVETALWDVCDLRENIGQPGLRIDIV